MELKMDWAKLLTKERLYSKNYDANPEFDARSEYQRDVDRIIFSSAFRRLQDKTQVLPFPGSDFVHTRLTHSLEVSRIGRSLGKLIGSYVIDIGDIDKKEYTADDFGNIVVAACLAHDIGNPPFGHTGEKAISKIFKKIFKDISKIDGGSISDFTNFEGNAAGFRILTNDHPSGRLGGIKLTYATLGAFSKYPCSSKKVIFNLLGKEISSRKSQTKYGYFYEERNIFHDVASKLGLLILSEDKDNVAWCRHPLSFLVEAADTFTYKIIDLEDAHKMGFITTCDAQSMLEEIVKVSPDLRCRIDDWKDIKDKDEKIGALRSKALNSLIYESYKVFKEKYTLIMTGKFDEELSDIIASQQALKKISAITKENFFKHSSVIDTEIAGFEILGGLIELFINALDDITDSKNQRLLMKLPSYIQDIISSQDQSCYKKFLVITDFVSRMTDTFALNLYKKFRGIEIT